MKTRSAALLRIAAAAAILATSGTAHAVLLDHGPADPTFLWPTWYRDLNGLALQECLSTVPGPNIADGGKPLCFPLNPDPAGFPGNVGPEVFYNANTTLVQKGNPNFFLKYLNAVEATYLPLGLPVHGTETVFARIRIIISTQTPGTYTVTHPFGVEVFNVTVNDLGPRAVFFTADVPFGPPMDFNTVLTGRVGPFMQWDFVDPGLSLTNSAGETFVGDPNLLHTYTGSPFGTNFVRVDGPPGSNLDGVGNTFIQTPLANVVGMKFGAAIPTPLSVKRATYSRDPVKNVIGIDVAATSAPLSQMVLTGAGMPSVQMKGDAAGNYFSHVEMPATAIMPAAVNVTNASSNPVNTVTAALVDLANITSATYDTLTRTLKVTATSSDLSVPPPALSVLGPFGGAMVAGSYTTLVPAAALPPLKVSIASSAGGTDTDDVAVLPGLTDAKPFPPVAIPDTITTNENTAISFDVTANDAFTPPAIVSQVVVVTAPANGTAAPIGINTGVVTYTPKAGYFNGGTSGVPPDTFQYVVIDSTGAVSNIATVTVNVNFVALGPAAGSTDFAMIQNSTTLLGKTVNVAAISTASPGTTLNAASVKITTLPLHGNVAVDALGNVTYTPLLKYVGADSYQYTIANTAGVASTPGTVSIVVEGGAEALGIAKATYTTAKSTWTIVGSTNWFGPTLLHTTMTCWVGKGVGVGPLIGTAPVDQFGKFQLVAGLAAPLPDATHIFTCQSSNAGGPGISAVVTVL